jgi:hypothetical protein
MSRSRVLFGCRSSSIIDLNGGGHTCHKNDTRRHVIDRDAHRDALRQAHPGEDGVDICDPLIVRLCDLTVAHKLYLGGIARADGNEVGLLEISIDAE